MGINWQGNPGYAGDYHRSIPLKFFEPFGKLPGVTLVSLQKNHGLEQLAGITGKFNVVELGSKLDVDSGPFLDTAAVMKNLDLFITSDTAVAHLAGALGVPTWMALSTAPDWRWMTKREDCAWYPSMRIFRQSVGMEWGPVFARLAAELHWLVPKGPMPTRSVTVEGGTPGELIDKITILEIKAQRIGDEAKRANVKARIGGAGRGGEDPGRSWGRTEVRGPWHPSCGRSTRRSGTSRTRSGTESARATSAIGSWSWRGRSTGPTTCGRS